MQETVTRMTRRPLCEFLVASCVREGGIFRYRLLDNGEAERISRIDMPSPMFFEVDGDKLWAVMRSPFEESGNSGIAAFDVRTGKQLTETVSTMGDVGCHIAVDGEDIYCANYISGSVFKSPDVLHVHNGHGVNSQRQEAPHVHSVFFSPDKKYVLSCDLGLDTVFVYDRNLNLVSSARVPDGSGARHIVFSKDGDYVYCINEMSATVSVFGYGDGELTYIRDVSAKPVGFTGQGKGAAIKLSSNGKRMYVTERGSESIAVFDVCHDILTRIGEISSYGKEPRDFTLLANGRFAACANQFSDSVSIYAVDSEGMLSYISSFALQAPICVAEI